MNLPKNHPDSDKIPADWLSDARSNEIADAPVTTVEAQIKIWINATEASIDEDGHVWVVTAGHGHWLTQEQIDDFMAWADETEFDHHIPYLPEGRKGWSEADEIRAERMNGRA